MEYIREYIRNISEYQKINKHCILWSLHFVRGNRPPITKVNETIAYYVKDDKCHTKRKSKVGGSRQPPCSIN
jgi:hypothetical protein